MKTMYDVYKAIQNAMIEDMSILAKPFDINKLNFEEEVKLSNKWHGMACVFADNERLKKFIQEPFKHLMCKHGDRYFHNFRLKDIDTVEFADVKLPDGKMGCNIHGLILHLENDYEIL